MAIVRLRARARCRGLEISNYRWFRTTVPLPLPQETIVALWTTWVSYWAGGQSFQMRHYQAEAQVYDDVLNLVQEGMIHKPTVPIAGLIPLIGSVKPELCAGIVRVGNRLRTRIYMTGFPHEYTSDGGELTTVGDIALSTVENNIKLALDEVLVSLKPVKFWEQVSEVYVQRELMTHNHRKQHVPLGLRSELPG